MINVLRKNQQALMIVIAVLCIPFIFYFSKSDMSRIANNNAGTLYGKPVSQVEVQRSARLFNLARDLGMYTFLQDMITNAQTQDEAYKEFTWNRMILRHEADRLGIHPEPYEIAGVIRNLRPFRSDTGFDINKYNEFTKNALPAMGFGDAQLEEIATDSIVLERLKDLVGTGVQMPAVETQDNYERAYGKLNVVVARLRTDDFAKDIQVSDDDITKYYEAHKEELKSEEKRKVSYVTFGLAEEQKQLKGKERIEPLQKLADRANDFNQALLEKGAEFHQVALKFQVPIQVTGEFTKAAPDPALATSPQLAESAFQLTPEQPNSDAIQAGDSFYVLHLDAVDPAKPLSIEEARGKIVDTLKSQRVRQLIATKGAEAAGKIRTAVAAGTPAEQAIQQAGLTPEQLEPFALADPPAMQASPDQPPKPSAPDLNAIKGAVADLNQKEATDFVPTEAGGVVAVLQSRDKPDTAGSVDQTRSGFTNRLLRNRRDVAFREWMRDRRSDAGIKAEPAEPVIGG